MRSKTARTRDKAWIYCYTQTSNCSCSPLKIKPSLYTSINITASQTEHRQQAGDCFWLWGLCSSGFCSSRGTVNQHYYGEVSQYWCEQMHHKPTAQRQKQNWFDSQWQLVDTQCLFRAVLCGCLKKHNCSPSHLIHLIRHLVISFSFCGYNCSYKCTVSRIPLKYRNDCWLSYMWFQKLSFSSGKRTQMTNNKGKDTFHYRLCPGTYGHALIKMKNFSPTDVLWNSRCSPNILIYVAAKINM